MGNNNNNHVTHNVGSKWKRNKQNVWINTYIYIYCMRARNNIIKCISYSLLSVSLSISRPLSPPVPRFFIYDSECFVWLCEWCLFAVWPWFYATHNIHLFSFFLAHSHSGHCRRVYAHHTLIWYIIYKYDEWISWFFSHVLARKRNQRNKKIK